MLRIAGIILACVLIVITAISFYAGMFDTMEISYGKVESLPLLYREHRGTYEGIRFIMNDVYRHVRDSLSRSADTGFAVFYDNPVKTPTDSLRSIAGIVSGDTVGVEKPYKAGESLTSEAVVGRFRLRSFFSYMSGSYKFTEQCARYVDQNSLVRNGPVLEMYDMVNRQIIYIAPCGTGVTPFPLFTGE